MRFIYILVMVVTVALFQNCSEVKLGLGNSIDKSLGKNPTQVTPVNNEILKISDSCAVVSSGKLKCWGFNGNGELGNGTYNPSTIPVEVLNLTGVVQVTSGWFGRCALLDSGKAKCWGYGGDGTLGNGANNNSSTPVEVLNLTDAIQISMGSGHVCAVLKNSHLKCWGANNGGNNSGQIGDGTVLGYNTAVEIPNLTGVVQVSAGPGFTCALMQTGTVKCWGNNGGGQLGVGSTDYNVLIPMDVLNLTDVIQIAAGSAHSCALLKSGNVKCWGFNNNGELGDGTKAYEYKSVMVTGLTGVKQISISAHHFTCALLEAGTVKCWGTNGIGSIGNLDSPTPLEIQGLSGAVQVASGWYHACALLSTGAVKCFGDFLGTPAINSSSKSAIDVLGL